MSILYIPRPTPLGEGPYSNMLAPDGYVYQCMACGKRARDRYGNKPIDYGFDESCMLNSMLVKQP